MIEKKDLSFKKLVLYALLFVLFAGIAVAVAMLLLNISERKKEAQNTYVKLQELSEDDTSPDKWAINFPKQFDSYRKTTLSTKTKYGVRASASKSD